MTARKSKRAQRPAGDVALVEPGADRRCLAQVELVILERDVPQYRSPVTRQHLQCCRFDRGHAADRRDATAFHRMTPDNAIGPILWTDGDERVVLVRERPVGERPRLRQATEREVRDYDKSVEKSAKGAA